MKGELSVISVDGLRAIERYAAEMDRLNAAAPRPNPFLSSAFLRCYALRSEFYTPGSGERLLVVKRGNAVIGCAPLRLTHEPIVPGLGLPVTATRLQFLAPVDTEQPHFLSAPADEEQVAAAIVRHVRDADPRWGMFELVGQPPGGVLHRALHAAANASHRVRDIQVEPYTEVPLAWPNLHAYFRSLTKHMRSNIGRQARRMYATGDTELVLARGAPAVSAWFEAYCDLDQRSWKHGTESSIQRHPRRVRFFKELVAGRSGLDPSFVGVVLDGVLVAGLIIGSNRSEAPERHGAWCLEMAYDRTRADLGPGQLLLLMAVGEALEERHAFLNFMQNFAYYKHRWGAREIPVVNVQMIRRVSYFNGRALAGDARRWWQTRQQRAKVATATAPAPATNSSDASTQTSPVNATAAVAESAPAPTAIEPISPVDREQARSLTQAALGYDGAGVRRLDRAGARAYLPFDIE